MSLAGIGLVGLFGALGALARLVLEEFVRRHWNLQFPMGTLLVNLLGSFLAGLLFGVFMQRSDIADVLKLSIMVGLLGGFTTFSALALQSFQMLMQKQTLIGLAYLLGSPVLGLMFVAAGFWLSKQAYS